MVGAGRATAGAGRTACAAGAGLRRRARRWVTAGASESKAPPAGRWAGVAVVAVTPWLCCRRAAILRLATVTGRRDTWLRCRCGEGGRPGQKRPWRATSSDRAAAPRHGADGPRARREERRQAFRGGRRELLQTLAREHLCSLSGPYVNPWRRLAGPGGGRRWWLRSALRAPGCEVVGPAGAVPARRALSRVDKQRALNRPHTARNGRAGTQSESAGSDGRKRAAEKIGISGPASPPRSTRWTKLDTCEHQTNPQRRGQALSKNDLPRGMTSKMMQKTYVWSLNFPA